MKIFVSICSYRDPLLQYTLDSLIENKSHRHQATYSVFEQTALEDSLVTKRPDLVAREDVVYKRIDPIYSDGVGWARAVNALNLEDEDFFYQIDSHMLFDEHWDRHLIEDYKRGVKKCGSKKVIIDGGTKTFNLNADGLPEKYVEHFPKTTKVDVFIYTKNDILGVHGSHIPATDDVVETIHLFAGNFFAHSDWVREVGIDHKIFWDGEEYKMTLESFEHGWHMFSPREIKCYHFVGSGNYVTKQWFEPIISDEVYGQRVQRSIKQWQDYLQNISEDVLERFREYSGIDYINQVIEEKEFPKTIKTGLGLPPKYPEDINEPEEATEEPKLLEHQEEEIPEEPVAPKKKKAEKPVVNEESESVNDESEDQQEV